MDENQSPESDDTQTDLFEEALEASVGYTDDDDSTDDDEDE